MPDSPFIGLADQLAADLRTLRRSRQAVFFGAAAHALAPAWRAWASVPGRENLLPLQHDALAAVAAWARGDELAVTHDLRNELRVAVPDDGTDEVGAAQDCTICLGIAIDAVLSSTGEPAESAWYVVEALFADVLDRLFGHTGGGDRENEEETVAAQDPALVAGLESTRTVIEALRAPGMLSTTIERLAEILEPICPDPDPWPRWLDRVSGLPDVQLAIHALDLALRQLGQPPMRSNPMFSPGPPDVFGSPTIWGAAIGRAPLEMTCGGGQVELQVCRLPEVAVFETAATTVDALAETLTDLLRSTVQVVARRYWTTLVIRRPGRTRGGSSYYLGRRRGPRSCLTFRPYVEDEVVPGASADEAAGDGSP